MRECIHYNIKMKKYIFRVFFSIELQKEYLKHLAIYETKLTSEQKDWIRNQKEKKKLADAKKQLKLKCNELGKPKRPANAYASFMVDAFKKFPNQKATIIVKQVTAAWKGLSDTERRRYVDKAEAAQAVYL